jgi:hypothetical protein
MKLLLQNVAAGVLVEKEKMMDRATWENIPLHRLGTSKNQEKWSRAVLQYAMTSKSWKRVNREEV